MAKPATTRKRPAVDPNETKGDKWVRLATGRVSKALEALQQLGKLSNPKQYDYTATQTKKLFDALDKGVSDCKASYATPGVAAKAGVNLAA